MPLKPRNCTWVRGIVQSPTRRLQNLIVYTVLYCYQTRLGLYALTASQWRVLSEWCEALQRVIRTQVRRRYDGYRYTHSLHRWRGESGHSVNLSLLASRWPARMRSFTSSEMRLFWHPPIVRLYPAGSIVLLYPAGSIVLCSAMRAISRSLSFRCRTLRATCTYIRTCS